jgi:hypothetical protein
VPPLRETLGVQQFTIQNIGAGPCQSGAILPNGGCAVI